MNTKAIIEAVATHALKTGWFERVNQHEPKAGPPEGLTCAIWAQRLGPVPSGSGLASTTARLEMNVRIYTNMLYEPADSIDPRIVGAVDDLMGAYSGDFTLGATIRNVDLLGQAGPGLEAVAGYLTLDQRLYRVMTIHVPLIVNDAWTQAP